MQHIARRGRHDGDGDVDVCAAEDKAGDEAKRTIAERTRRAVGIGVILSQNLLNVFGGWCIGAETSQWVPSWFPG
jgi:hypothetical protein